MMNKRETARFCSQLKMMLASGMPLLEALKVIKDLAANKRFRQQLEGLVDQITEGCSLSESANLFLPPLAMGSLRAAERAGNLEETLDYLAKYYESKAELDEKIKGALVYPCFVLVLCLISILALFVFVIPGLKEMFDDLGAELPMITNLVLSISDLFYQVWFPLAGALLGAGILIICLLRNKPEMVEGFALRIPIFRTLIQKELTIQGFSTLGALLNSGTPLIEALTITANSSRSKVFKETILRSKEKVENGGRLSVSFEESRFFAPESIQMLKVGEGSGQLAGMLLNIADFQARERESFLKRFTTLLEPIMTLSVGLVVGLVVMAMFLPLVNMISSLK